MSHGKMGLAYDRSGRPLCKNGNHPLPFPQMSGACSLDCELLSLLERIAVALETLAITAKPRRKRGEP